MPGTASVTRHQVQSESGLGLAIARWLVTAHGGEISATSVVGAGTTIAMTFDSGPGLAPLPTA